MARFRRMYRSGRRFRGRGQIRWRNKNSGRSSMGGLGNPKFLLGIGAGVIAPQVIPYQDAIITALAVLPVPKMGLGAPARGYVLGRLARGFVPALSGIAGGTSAGSSDFA